MRRPSRHRSRRVPPITEEQIEALLAFPSLEDDGDALAELLDALAAEAERCGAPTMAAVSPRVARLAARIFRGLTSKVRATP